MIIEEIDPETAAPICEKTALSNTEGHPLSGRSAVISLLNDTIEEDLGDGRYKSVCQVDDCSFACEITTGDGTVSGLAETVVGECVMQLRSIRPEAARLTMRPDEAR